MKILYITSPRSGTHYFKDNLFSVAPQLKSRYTHLHTGNLEKIKDVVNDVGVTHILYLLRKDTLRQAISLVRARRIDAYHKVGEHGTRKSDHDAVGEFDFNEILKVRVGLENKDHACHEYLSSQDMPVLTLFYEDFLCRCSLIAEIQSVLNFLDLPSPRDMRPRSVLTRTRNYHSEMWYRMFVKKVSGVSL